LENFYDHLVHFVFIWYIFPALVSCTKKNLATLPSRFTSFSTQVCLEHFRDPDFLEDALRRYRMYLFLKRLHTQTFLVPCYDIDLVPIYPTKCYKCVLFFWLHDWMSNDPTSNDWRSNFATSND
jgi:hypothetical protein